MTRQSAVYIIDEVRRLSGVGTAEFSVGTVSYFTDAQIERILDSRRIRLHRHEIVFEPELSSGGGTVIYKHARIGFPWVEDVSEGGTTDQFKITDTNGSIIGTTNYTLSPEDGFVTFSADQHGSIRYVTGWVHNPYKAAYEVLLSWSFQLARQPDWATDNMRVWRSQKVVQIREQMKQLKEMAGLAPNINVISMDRPDIYVEDVVEPKVVYDKIPAR